MKSVTVIALALAFIYWFEIGKAVRWELKKEMTKKKVTVRKRLEDLKQLSEYYVNEADKNFTSMKVEIKDNVKYTLRSGYNVTKDYANSAGKADNKSVDECLGMGIELLQNTSVVFMEKFDNETEIRKNEVARWTDMKNIPREGKSITAEINKIIMGDHNDKDAITNVTASYNNFKHRVARRKQVMSNKFKRNVLVMFKVVPKLMKFLGREVNKIIRIVKKCIDKP